MEIGELNPAFALAEIKIDAECWGENPELFIYSSKGFMNENQEMVEKALRYCQVCRVREKCLEYGLTTNKDNYAIYGGVVLSPKRKEITLKWQEAA